MTPTEFLTAARALLTPPERWTKKAYARHKNGKPIGPTEGNAVSFCMTGALLRIVDNGTPYVIASGLLTQATGRELVFANDDPATTHADVLRWFDEAIARATEAERV